MRRPRRCPDDPIGLSAGIGEAEEAQDIAIVVFMPAPKEPDRFRGNLSVYPSAELCGLPRRPGPCGEQQVHGMLRGPAVASMLPVPIGEVRRYPKFFKPRLHRPQPASREAGILDLPPDILDIFETTVVTDHLEPSPQRLALELSFDFGHGRDHIDGRDHIEGVLIVGGCSLGTKAPQIDAATIVLPPIVERLGETGSHGVENAEQAGL